MITRKEYIGCEGDRKKRNASYIAFYSQFIVPSTVTIACTIAQKIESKTDDIDSLLNEYRDLVFWDRQASRVGIPLDIYNQAYEKTCRAVWVSDKLCILKTAVRAALIDRGFVEVWVMTKFGYLESRLVRER